MFEITIIVCTRNRAKSLANTLDSLMNAISNAPRFQTEVVLVDNGSWDNTQYVLNTWKSSAAFPVTVLVEPKPGLSAARNAAIRSARGTILVFTDDDCTLNPDYLIRLKHYYDNDSRPVVRGGKVELGDPTDQPFSIKLDDEMIVLTDLIHPGGFIIGANMTMHRDVIKGIGSFDERFGAGSVFRASEDTDFIFRAHSAGFKVEYVPDMIVQHFHGRKDIAVINELNYGYQVGHGALYAKHIRTYLFRHFYWDMRKSVAELQGGNILNASVGLPYSSLMRANIQGMLLYLAITISTFFKKIFSHGNTN